jgi:hypothetical protein
VTEQGGDPACWADRVCAACGMLDERRRRDGRCPHCGATAEDDPAAAPPPPPTGAGDRPDDRDHAPPPTGAGDRPDDRARPEADPPAGR